MATYSITIKTFTMKSILQFLMYAFVAVVSGMMLFSCSKPASDPIDTNPVNPGDTAKVSKLFERLLFQDSIKKVGNMPGAPTGSSLKNHLTTLCIWWTQ